MSANRPPPKPVLLEKFTYGRTPAAIYLAAHLNKLNDPKLMRKVSHRLAEFRTLLNELEASNTEGSLSLRSLGSIVSMLNASAKLKKEELLAAGHTDTLVLHLMTNLMVGDSKSLLRRAGRAKVLTRLGQQTHREVNGALETSEGEIFSEEGYLVGVRKPDNTVQGFKFTAGEMEDTTTPEHLAEKSRRNLARRGKPCELY